MNPLKALSDHGQSVWLDFLSREFLDQHGLERLIEQDRLAGVTSNPSIFEKAIGETSQYDADIAAGLGGGNLAVGGIYERLAVADIRRAADVLRPVYETTAARDGFVSLEVSPYLAMDTEATVAEARRLWNTVDRPNVMIKVPGSAPGLPAIRQLLGEGLNINITLLFAQRVYEDVVEAYFGGLEALLARGRPLDRIASVASFFVSRIDTVVDRALEEKMAHADAVERAMLSSLKGKVAIANAKLAYQIYLRCFSGPRWANLARLGAAPQRLLWASTGTKNPMYRDGVYVEELIGASTVNTMPLATMDAFRDHGRVRGDTLTEDVAAAREVLARLHRASISLDQVTSRLLDDGVRQFSDAFDTLLGAVADKRRRMLGASLNETSMSLDATAGADLHKLEEAWRRAGNVRRLWAKDAGLWTDHDEGEWLGWLDVVDTELRNTGELEELQQKVRAGGFTSVVLLGMGGSSLGPQVLGRTLGSAEGFPQLHVLDSTDPEQIRLLESTIELERTLFIVSSKSGSTLEPNIFMDYFLARATEVLGKSKAAEHFIAITDPGSQLHQVADQNGFGKVYFGVPSIGGRYSVLSRFGLVPLAVMGRNVEQFLQTANPMVRSCGPEVPPAQNPGVEFGLMMGALQARGRDKITIVASPSIAAFGAWAEQLIAESTGKQGKGLIPIDAEPLASPSNYGPDRFFVYLRDQARPDADQDRAVEGLERVGQPILRIGIAAPDRLAQEFFRWELATAVAGAVIGINPFDQPDVEASKVATNELTEAYEKTGSLPPEVPVFDHDGIALFADAGNAQALKAAGAGNTLESWLSAHFARLRPGDYLAILAFVAQTPGYTRGLEELRARVLERKHVATCLGFGPRFLHSTGQAYKGGPPTGVFLQITADDGVDLEIPGRHASFAVVKAAQARGDFRVLAERGRRLLRAHLTHDVGSGLAMLGAAASRALS